MHKFVKLESKTQAEIIKDLNKLPKCFAYKQHPPPKGIPDVYCCLNGMSFHFEVKRRKVDNARKLQEFRMKQIRRAGGFARVVRSKTEVMRYIIMKMKNKVTKGKAREMLSKLATMPKTQDVVDDIDWYKWILQQYKGNKR